MIGTVVLVRFEHVLIPCRLLDTTVECEILQAEEEHSPTLFRLVEPVNGVGRQWVESCRVGAEIKKKSETDQSKRTKNRKEN